MPRTWTMMGLLAVLPLGSLGCSREDANWKRAENKNTIGIYEAFITAHLQSARVEVARQRIDAPGSNGR